MLGRGTVKKTAGAGISRFEMPFSNAGELHLNGLDIGFDRGLLQSGANSLTDLAGGTLTLAPMQPPLTVNGGVVKGGGTIDGSVQNNGGVFEVGSDVVHLQLEVTGDYTQEEGATLRIRASGNTWLALSNVRAYAQRVTGVVSPLAMAVVFVLTYTLAQTTVLAATADDTRTGTPAQYRLTAPALGGLPTGTPAAVRRLPGVEAAAAVGTTTVVWPYRMFGDTETESASALVLTPAAKDVLDLGVTRGSLSALTGATIDACARALLRAGAAEVDVLAFARVVAGPRAPI